jgi:hypothetical protein
MTSGHWQIITTTTQVPKWSATPSDTGWIRDEDCTYHRVIVGECEAIAVENPGVLFPVSIYRRILVESSSSSESSSSDSSSESSSQSSSSQQSSSSDSSSQSSSSPSSDSSQSSDSSSQSPSSPSSDSSLTSDSSDSSDSSVSSLSSASSLSSDSSSSLSSQSSDSTASSSSSDSTASSLSSTSSDSSQSTSSSSSDSSVSSLSSQSPSSQSLSSQSSDSSLSSQSSQSTQPPTVNFSANFQRSNATACPLSSPSAATCTMTYSGSSYSGSINSLQGDNYTITLSKSGSIWTVSYACLTCGCNFPMSGSSNSPSLIGSYPDIDATSSGVCGCATPHIIFSGITIS